MSGPSVQDEFYLACAAYALQEGAIVALGTPLNGWAQSIQENYEQNYSAAGPTYATFVKGHNVIIAFRGSTNPTDWFSTDAQIAAGYEPKQLDEALTYVKQIEAYFNKYFVGDQIFLTGHSLGGIEAARSRMGGAQRNPSFFCHMSG